jgi:hypothetical protein
MDARIRFPSMEQIRVPWGYDNVLKLMSYILIWCVSADAWMVFGRIAAGILIRLWTPRTGMLAFWAGIKTPDMRVFTGWNNPFGGSGNRDICKTLVSGTLEVPLEGLIQNPLI